MIPFAVLVASFAAMTFELAGVRGLSPYLGATIETWTATIAAVLGGLALGYWQGGKVADRRPQPRTLALALFLAGACVTLAALMRDAVPLLVARGPFSLATSALLIGIILFVPASAFLGAVSPLAARLLLRKVEEGGRTVGSVSAFATLGSIAGTIATGMILIPRFGTGLLLGGTGIALVLLSFLVERRWLWWLRLGVLVGALFLLRHDTTLLANARAVVDTAYARIVVVDTADASGITRSVHTDPYGTQCAAKILEDGTASTEPVFGYTKFFDIGTVMRPNTERALVLGGCNLSYPRHLLAIFPDAAVDAVEIDPGMLEIARDQFGVTPDPRLNVHVEDARRFLNAAGGAYDLVYGDAFASAAAIPPELTTREALGHVARLLAPDGVYVMNVFNAVTGPDGNFARAEYATLRDVFPHVRAFATTDADSNLPQNLVFVASKVPLPDPASDPKLTPYFAHPVSDEKLQGGIVLTDDYMPVEALTGPMRETLRRFLYQ